MFIGCPICKEFALLVPQKQVYTKGNSSKIGFLCKIPTFVITARKSVITKPAGLGMGCDSKGATGQFLRLID
jgi:hypothetical protein